ncbi:MAG TPA: nucleotide exchange factor GrpE [Patescibacteria group bacterium]|nr:nucleotide exchange factor GrpE [Patescibacteria group bacterium]
MDDQQDNIVDEVEEADSEVEGEEKDNKKSKGSKKTDEVKELKERIEELDNQFKRAVADYRNLEKRFEEEKRETIRYANRDLLLNLIPAFDTLFLADKFTTDESVKLTVKHIQDILQRVGVERVKTDGADFDPIVMEAVATEKGTDGKVLEELRPGFTLNGKLIRPAQVKVGKES